MAVSIGVKGRRCKPLVRLGSYKPMTFRSWVVDTMKYDMDLTLDAGCGHAFDKLLLEDEEDYNQRDNG